MYFSFLVDLKKKNSVTLLIFRQMLFAFSQFVRLTLALVIAAFPDWGLQNEYWNKNVKRTLQRRKEINYQMLGL